MANTKLQILLLSISTFWAFTNPYSLDNYQAVIDCLREKDIPVDSLKSWILDSDGDVSSTIQRYSSDNDDYFAEDSENDEEFEWMDEEFTTHDDFVEDTAPVVAMRCHNTDMRECSQTLLARQFSVFKRLGYTIRPITKRTEINQGWEVIWSFQYPWECSIFPRRIKDDIITPIVQKIAPNQKINHFPGEAIFANKRALCATGLKYLPKTFELPDEAEAFLEYNNQNQKKYWVTKNFSHRGVQVLEFDEIDLSNTRLIQEFITNPLLLDGYMFDIGVYVALTSVNPLRVYTYDNEWRIKISKQKYYPFDLTNQRKYVMEGHINIQKMEDLPGLSQYYNNTRVSDKEAFMFYFRDQGYDMNNIETTMKNAIKDVFLQSEDYLVQEGLKYADSMRNYFGLYRVDFIINQDLEVKLIETNMSPSVGVTPDAVRKTELMNYQLLSLLGLANSGLTLRKLSYSENDHINAATDSYDLSAWGEECIINSCSTNCSKDICSLCWSCMTEDDKTDLQAAFHEHRNRHGYQRVFPEPYGNQEKAKDKKVDQSLNPRNQWLTEWYRGKCLQSQSWCL